MSKFRKKPVVIEAITFDELVAYGLAHPDDPPHDRNVVNGFPWSFKYNGHPITHETDTCYLIPTPEGTMKFNRGEMLITGVKGEIYPCKADIFAATYDPVPPTYDGPPIVIDEIANDSVPAPKHDPEAPATVYEVRGVSGPRVRR